MDHPILGGEAPFQTKLCGACRSVKPTVDFHKSKQGKFGVCSKCKTCANVAARAWHHANKEAANKTSNQRRLVERESVRAYMADYYARNRATIKAAVREREHLKGDALKPVNAEKAMRRIARKRMATPVWADAAAILAFYTESARITRETGTPHHVDHIVPLQSRFVCGLHVEHNLQVLQRSDNQSKSNRWWPDGPAAAL